MKVLYQIPSLDTIYAGRTIYAGYKNAFEDMGHEFLPFTADDDFEQLCKSFNPDIFITGLNSYYMRYLNLDYLQKRKQHFKNFKVFINIPYWISPIAKYRVNETPGLGGNTEFIHLLQGPYFDICFNSCEQGDERMTGFEEGIGKPYYTLPLAADKTLMKPDFGKEFEADISFIGTNLPQKREYFREWLFPLKKQFQLRLYGQDWSFGDRILGHVQRIGQYFNIPYVRSIRKPKLGLGDEAKIYSSTKISVNLHEDYQRKFGGDCNERTFKILACGGFEITDDLTCIRKYFEDGKEIVIAKSKEDWFEKVSYYMKHPEEREAIAEAGKKKVLAEHTYHNRVQQIIDIYHGNI